MIKSFLDTQSESFYVTGKSKKIPSTIHKVALRKLDYLNAAFTVEDLPKLSVKPLASAMGI